MLEYLYDVRSCILKLRLLHIGNVSQYTVIFKRKKKRNQKMHLLFSRNFVFGRGGGRNSHHKSHNLKKYIISKKRAFIYIIIFFRCQVYVLIRFVFVARLIVNYSITCLAKYPCDFN